MHARGARRAVARAATIAFVAGGVLVPVARAADNSPQPSFRVPLPHVLSVADSLFKIGKHAEAEQYLDSLVVRVRTSHDTRLLRQTLYVRGRQFFGRGDARSAEANLREALALSMAAHDSLLAGHSMRWLGPALEYLGRPKEASTTYDSLLAAGRQMHDRYLEAAGIWGRTTQRLRDGDLAGARRDFETCLPIFRELGAVNDETYALLGFVALQVERLGDYDGARRTLQRVLALSRDAGIKEVEGGALNNLAEIELDIGDPGDAMRYWQAAMRVAEQAPSVSARTHPMAGLASAYLGLGQLDDAVALYDSVLQIGRSKGLMQQQAVALLGIAVVRAEQGRLQEAAQLRRAVLAMGDSLDGTWLLQATIDLARGEAPSEGGLKALRDRARELEARIGVTSIRNLRVEEAAYLMRLGRYAEARRCWQGQPSSLTTEIQIAMCERELGHPDSALAALRRATRFWEQARSQPRDPEWRESRSALARAFLTDLVDLTLQSTELPKDARVRAAFDVAQGFKSRTYLERMAGPSAARPGAAGRDSILSSAQLQRDVLREGDVFLDAVVGDRASFLFAVTRDSLRVERLPGATDLDERIRLYRDLVATPAAGDKDLSLAVSQRAGGRLSQLLLGDFADLLRDSRCVILSLDGSLHLLTFGEMPLPRGTRPAPLLGDGRAVTRVPSAAVLAAIRRRATSNGSESNVLVFATSHTPNEVELPGVAREARALASRYDHVRLHLNDTPDVAPQMELPQYDVLHFASHTSIDDQRPWNSGFLLRPVATPEVPVRLRASEILAMPLRARLCVLSGCESAAGKTLTGEGVESLAGAFLCAGVPTVVATAWPVDDATTERFMRLFYAALERGHTAAAAIGDAQATFRADSRTRAPFFWAGYVLVGEPETRVTLARRHTVAAAPRTWLVGGIAALLLCGSLLSFWVGRRSRAWTKAHAPGIAWTRWASATGLTVLALWMVLDRGRGAESAATLRAGSSHPAAELYVRCTAEGSRGLRLEWDAVAAADSYAVQLYSPDLARLDRARVVGEPRFVLGAGNARVAPAPDTLLARVVAMRQGATLAKSAIIPVRLR